MPLAGDLATNEIATLCDDIKCKNINDWINRLRKFKEEYDKIRTYHK